MEGAPLDSTGSARATASPDYGGRKPAADPYTLRDKLFRSLPRYTGPYTVGMMDIEIPVRQPRVFSDITRKKHHLLQLETVLFTIYYPAAEGTGRGIDPAGRKRWSRETWLPKPRGDIARGYGIFVGTPGWVATSWFLRSTWFTKVPAFRNAQVATPYPIKTMKGKQMQSEC